MGCCESKPNDIDTALTAVTNPHTVASRSTLKTNVKSDDEPHQAETFETKDHFNSPDLRAVGQFLLDKNIANNTLQFDSQELLRKPDPKTQEELEPAQIQEVFDHLLKWFETFSFMTKSGTGQMQFNAAQFKNMNMRKSYLSPHVIEAALTHILDHRNEYSQLTDMGDMMYHDQGSIFNSAGTRIFVFGKI